jgi:isoleucyl-tRNA synthetase
MFMLLLLLPLLLLICLTQVEAIKERLLANNEQTYWVPSYVKEKRFHNWLEGAHDWAISRSRCGWQ